MVEAGAALLPSPSSPPSPPSSSPLRRALLDVLAGTAGGVGLVVVGHPFDTLKVRLQTQSHSHPRYAGLLDCVQQTYSAEGLRGFYRGVASPLLGQMLFNAIQFMAYTRAKELVGGLRGRSPAASLEVSDYFAAGALTGLAVSLVECPIDLFKTQLQTQVFQPQPRFTSLPQTVAFIARGYGVRGVFQGLGPTLTRNVPAVASYFGCYEWVRRTLAARKGASVDELSTAEVLLAGACGGFAYWSIYPIDCVKSAMQADAVERSQRLYRGMGDAARAMWREGGVGRFFKGLSPCLLRAAPANAVCFLVYERALGWIDQLLP